MGDGSSKVSKQYSIYNSESKALLPKDHSAKDSVSLENDTLGKDGFATYCKIQLALNINFT